MIEVGIEALANQESPGCSGSLGLRRESHDEVVMGGGKRHSS